MSEPSYAACIVSHPSKAPKNMAMDQSESERLLRALAHGGFVVAWTAGADGAFLTPQPSWEAFTGQSWKDQAGHGWLAAIPESERSRLVDALRLGASVKFRSGLWSVAHGRHVPISMTWTTQAQPIGAAVWQCIAFPVGSGVSQLEDRLAKCEREFEEFAAIASHDLREPIRGISNFASFVLEDYGPALEGDARDKLRTITRLAGRMNAQVDALMEYCALRSSSVRRRRTDLNEVVRRAAFELGCSAEAVAVARPLPEAFCDPALITAVVSKLIHNGLKFNQSDVPRVEIEGVSDGSEAVVTVRDNGIGIAQGQIGRLFHMFKRLNPRERFEGTGAGLAISRRIIELHGGRIWIDCGDGRGTAFCFSLPHAGLGGPDAGVDPVDHAH